MPSPMNVFCFEGLDLSIHRDAPEATSGLEPWYVQEGLSESFSEDGGRIEWSLGPQNPIGYEQITGKLTPPTVESEERFAELLRGHLLAVTMKQVRASGTLAELVAEAKDFHANS